MNALEEIEMLREARIAAIGPMLVTEKARELSEMGMASGQVIKEAERMWQSIPGLPSPVTPPPRDTKAELRQFALCQLAEAEDDAARAAVQVYVVRNGLTC